MSDLAPSTTLYISARLRPFIRFRFEREGESEIGRKPGRKLVGELRILRECLLCASIWIISRDIINVLFFGLCNIRYFGGSDVVSATHPLYQPFL